MQPQLSFNLSGANDATKSGLSMGTYDMGTMAAVNGGGAPVSSNTGLPSATVDPITTGGGGTNAFGQQMGDGNFWTKDGGAGMILGGVQALGNLWSTYQQHKMAKEQMSFAREQWDTNLANQTQTYNTALEDRIRSRHHTEGKGSGQTDAYLEKHSL